MGDGNQRCVCASSLNSSMAWPGLWDEKKKEKKRKKHYCNRKQSKHDFLFSVPSVVRVSTFCCRLICVSQDPDGHRVCSWASVLRACSNPNPNRTANASASANMNPTRARLDQNCRERKVSVHSLRIETPDKVVRVRVRVLDTGV